uniref:Uncharacterized protein n=1 Tax=Pipistrellus kuhlii TaxID=59472 RepID=A0A7J7VMP2_PIPKU|nr:hypothetical protein mPipKuh1_008448 [Pipistrellus kuhlii]
MEGPCLDVVAAKGWGGNFSKYASTEVYCSNWLFLSKVTSLQHARLLDSILPTELLSKLESVLSNAVTASPTKFWNTLHPLLPIQQLLQHLHQEWIPHRETTVVANSSDAISQPLNLHRENAAIQAHIQALIPVLLMSPHLQLLPPLKS